MSIRAGIEETEGIIIGGWFVKYQFLQECETFYKHGIKGQNGKPILDVIDCNYFESDADALEWFEENHPEEWAARLARPIEMRVFDQPGKKEQAAIDAANKRG